MQSNIPIPSKPFEDVLSYWMVHSYPNSGDESALISQDSSNSSNYIVNGYEFPAKIVREAAKQAIFSYIEEELGRDYDLNTFDLVRNMNDEFSVNIRPDEIITEFPKLTFLLNRVEKIISGFSEQALRSSDAMLSLCESLKNDKQFIKTIKENPFLKDAFFENPHFAIKLIIKYARFDELSKENIQTLFDAKKEILADNPEIDPESLEFRQLMQERLKEYKNNREILEAIKENSVNVDEWLNYSETRYFNLESGNEHLAFSETISAPIERIKETIDSYAHTLKETLKEYRPELSEFKIPLEDSKETEEKIAKMQEELEKAKTEGSEKKAQGIEKGIESLQKKLETIKKVSLWDKLLGDIAAFQQLKNDVFSAQERLMQAEKDLQEKLGDKMPSGKMIQDLKEKINKAKEELRSKFGVLERRIEDFRTNLPELIAPCLNQGRTDALIQEIEQNLAEQFDHWNTDRRDLANLFSEKGDEEKKKMAKQPMSIFVWARNPDIDLYQGNYTDCCIRIDSDIAGAKSTIADYNTDLGIQVVNIWDEIKNEPVSAAWCWIGKSESGDTVLVVDNIEAYPAYKNAYPEQLSKELLEYIKKYGETIGVKKIVLGKKYNDLPTAGEINKMKNDETGYYKVGGHNRVDGYYFDVEEGDSVKLLWEKSDSAEAKKKKEKKSKPIEFKNLSIESLAEKDFDRIKQLERKIYAGTDLISGQAMIEDIKQGNGLEYSIVITGEKSKKSRQEVIGYIAATEGETDEGDPCIYMEDIAVIPEAQGQGIGWEMLRGFVEKLKAKARKEEKPILLDMHLRENSQRFMERHHNDLERIGAKLIEEALVPAGDYYDDEDALYQVYQISAD